MNARRFKIGDLVTFKYGPRTVQGVVKENRGPIGIKGRVLYLVEFPPESGSTYLSRIELPADELEAVKGSVVPG